MEHDRGVISLVEKLDSQTRRKLEHRFKKAIVRQLFRPSVSCTVSFRLNAAFCGSKATFIETRGNG